MELETAIAYLGEYIPIRSHTEIKQGINNSIIIDDTWSSNPTSMSAALEVLSDIGRNKQKLVVLGKISYLGKFKNNFYRQIAREIVSLNIDKLITIDEDAERIGRFAINNGMNPNNVLRANTKQALTETLNKHLNNDTIALFKTSMLDKNSQELLQEIIIK